MSVLLTVRVQPRASRTAFRGRSEDGVLTIAVASPPVDGAANAALLKFLGRKLLGIAPSSLTLERGATSRIKTIRVDGLTRAEVDARLDALG